MKGKAYVISAAAICAQEPFSKLKDMCRLPSDGQFFPCKDPDFRQFINPMASRRMSPILKRSIAVSKYALEMCGSACPDAIITGTGNGCVSDTEVFLNQIIDGGESLLNPSKFINSTPNTMGSQIAILLGCKGFNSTHVNDRFAFEGALMDAIFQLEKGKIGRLLLCTADQMTDGLYDMLNRDGLWKGIPVSEGAMAFVLSPSEDGAYAVVEDIMMSRSNPSWELDRFLSLNSLSWSDIDLVATSEFEEGRGRDFPFVPEDKKVIAFKNFCGEFFTASAFGFHFCSELLRERKAERILLLGKSSGAYSFILLRGLCTN